MNELTHALTKKLSPKTTLKDVKELVQAHYNVLHCKSFEVPLSERDNGRLEVLEWLQEMLEGAA